MTTTVDRNKDFPAPTGTGADSGRKSQETVLLSDIPDAATLTSIESISLALADTTPGSAVLPALAPLTQRYDILGEAGHGEVGMVYKARDRETQHVVALKLIKPEFASDPDMMERLKSGVLSARKITHRNVCRVYEFNRIGGIACASMEFVEGESLREVLNHFGRIPLRKALDVTLQLCAGLRAVHAQGILHRHLKPENVMIDSRGNVKILNLGIARSMGSATRLTSHKIGISAYTAPEQVSGKPADCRTDIYLLGLVLYEVFTGKQAAAAGNRGDTALQQMHGMPVPPHEIEPTIPVSVERAILKCLETEPANRFGSIMELEQALTSSGTRAVLASPSGPAPTLANRQAITRPAAATASPVARSAQVWKRKSLAVWIVLGACILTATAMGMHWMAVSRTAWNLPPPSRLAPPAPPEFAGDKQEAQPSTTRSGQSRPNAPKREPSIAASQSEAVPRSSIASANIPASTSQSQASPPGTVLPPSGDKQQRGTPDLGAVTVSPNASGGTYLWIGRFAMEYRARETAKKIEDLGLPAAVVPRRNPNGEFFVVLCGPFAPKKIPDVLPQLESQGFSDIRQIRNLILDQKLNP
jgi:serine/threonine-protein kinase